MAQFSLYVRKGGLKPHSSHFICTNMSFHPLEIVGRGSETQLQVGKNLNYIITEVDDND